MHNFFGRAVVVFLVLIAVGGCDRRPRRVPVAGQVLIDGQPLGYGIVLFTPTGTRPSMGTLDENGRFVMTCYGDDDGVIPGTHRVAIIGSEIVSTTKIKWHAPKKYSNIETSDLLVEVDKANEELVIEISWNGGKPYIERSGRGTADDLGDDV